LWNALRMAKNCLDNRDHHKESYWVIVPWRVQSVLRTRRLRRQGSTGILMGSAKEEAARMPSRWPSTHCQNPTRQHRYSRHTRGACSESQTIRPAIHFRKKRLIHQCGGGIQIVHDEVYTEGNILMVFVIHVFGPPCPIHFRPLFGYLNVLPANHGLSFKKAL